jgi:hypothetical protein
LPKAWRDELNTEVFQASYNESMIILTPIRTASEAEVKKRTQEFIEENRDLLKALA